MELRPPALSRIFERSVGGHKLKHVIEPHATYRYVTGVNNFDSILRFDARDILSNTNEVEYGFINRLYSKRTSEQPEDCAPQDMSSLRIGAPGEQIQPWERTYIPGNIPCSGRAADPRDCHLGDRRRNTFLIPTLAERS